MLSRTEERFTREARRWLAGFGTVDAEFLRQENVVEGDTAGDAKSVAQDEEDLPEQLTDEEVNKMVKENYPNFANPLDILELIAKQEQRPVNLFIDEADVGYKLVRDVLLSQLNKAVRSRVQVYPMTATPDGLFQLVDELKLNEHRDRLESYNFLRDMDWRAVPASPDLDLIGQLNAMLDTCPTELEPHDYLFVPSFFKKTDHIKAAEVLAKRGISALVINGDGYTFWRGGMPAPDELVPKKGAKSRLCADGGCRVAICTQCHPAAPLLDIIKHFRAKSPGPMALTGNGCLGRAITVHEPGLELTYALLARDTV
ncbi:hypothetical protein WJX72_009387 [[Myrmecia] bisecta]|uniref:Uncharacterized protein n=1 Tax=[Myrmecia] bisecta TaxID=41462 RepID=A0AAW1Q4K9_9CHLO